MQEQLPRRLKLKACNDLQRYNHGLRDFWRLALKGFFDSIPHSLLRGSLLKIKFCKYSLVVFK